MLEIGYWNKTIENEHGNLRSSQHQDAKESTATPEPTVPKHWPHDDAPITRNAFYPRCDGTTSETIKPINRIEIKHFLIDFFRGKCNGLKILMLLETKLFVFESSGVKI